MNPLLLMLKGDTLGKTLYNCLAAIALVGVLGWVGFVTVSGTYWKWKAGRAGDRAERAEAHAQVAQGNADSANAGAANAAQTRAAVDSATVDIRITTEQAAGRLENYETLDADDSGALPADLVRELDAARTRAGTAADRLQRKGARGATAR